MFCTTNGGEGELCTLIPKPTLAPGRSSPNGTKNPDVLVQVKAFGLNPVDYKIRTWAWRWFRQPTLGRDFAGVVVDIEKGEVGEDEAIAMATPSPVVPAAHSTQQQQRPLLKKGDFVMGIGNMDAGAEFVKIKALSKGKIPPPHIEKVCFRKFVLLL